MGDAGLSCEARLVIVNRAVESALGGAIDVAAQVAPAVAWRFRRRQIPAKDGARRRQGKGRCGERSKTKHQHDGWMLYDVTEVEEGCGETGKRNKK